MTTVPHPLALINARLVDPAHSARGDAFLDDMFLGGVFIRDGTIADVGAHLATLHGADGLPRETTIIDCKRHHLAPGLIDMRAFVGEPGFEHRETLASVAQAALHGGVTTLLMRPDTAPCVDDPAVVDFILRRARDGLPIRILPTAALTKNLAGAEIAELGLLQAAGAVAFGDGANFVANAQVMARALTYARNFDALVISFCLEPQLKGDGALYEGLAALRLGLPALPRAAEIIAVERDLRLLDHAGGRMHIALVSTQGALDAIRAAKARGLAVTCGVSINHLTLNERDVGDYRTFLKLMPPLVGEEERRALVAGVADGTVDVIVSDHEPRDVEEKRLPFAEAAAGAIGVETMLAAGLRLVHGGDLSLRQLVRAMTLNPAKILGLPQGALAVGAPADLIVFDPDEPFVLDPLTLHSRARNTPFDGARLMGRIKRCFVGGQEYVVG